MLKIWALISVWPSSERIFKAFLSKKFSSNMHEQGRTGCLQSIAFRFESRSFRVVIEGKSKAILRSSASEESGKAYSRTESWFSYGYRQQQFDFSIDAPLANYLPNLEHLSLSIGFPPALDNLKELTHLRSISVHFDGEVNGLHSPDVIIFPRNLIKSNITRDFPGDLPNSINCLKNLPLLNYLMLDYFPQKNLFSHLGASLLTSLKIYGQSANIDLTDLSSLRSLELLEIKGCEGHYIDTISANLGAFCPLKTIEFINIHPIVLPDWTENFCNLERLIISDSNLNYWPEKLLISKNLRCLDFSKNFLRHEPPFPIFTQSLEFVDIDHNFLEKIPFFVFLQHKLKNLIAGSLLETFAENQNRFWLFDFRPTTLLIQVLCLPIIVAS